MSKTTKEVINNHLERRKQGDLEGDINENLSHEIYILSTYGVFKGHDGVLESSAKLKELLGDATFQYDLVLIEKNFGFLKWSGESHEKMVTDGADSFVVENGKIVFQSCHYTVKSRTENDAPQTK